jgi:hypothetical protein
MGEGHTEGELRGGEHAAEPRRPAEEPVSESGWVTTEVAAEALDVSPRTVRDYIANRKLEAKSEGEGVERRWLVSIDSVQAMREARRAAARSPRERREGLRGGEAAGGVVAHGPRVAVSARPGGGPGGTNRADREHAPGGARPLARRERAPPG